MLLLPAPKFKPSDSVRTKGQHPMSGTVQDVRQVGCIYQIGVMTQYGRFLFRENELEMVAPGRGNPAPVAEAKPAVLPETPRPTAPAKPTKVKIDYLGWYKELFSSDLRSQHPEYNNGQLAMKAKRDIQSKLSEVLKDKNLEDLYLESSTYKSGQEV